MPVAAAVSPPLRPRSFFGHAVVRAAFVLAIVGWGVGFYGPPIFLHAVLERTGWSLPLVSGAVTVHFLFGALVVAALPRIHAAFGVVRTTVVGVAAMAFGVLGWAVAADPVQLYLAALLSGGGWVTMGAAAINAILSPWFVRTRPAALAKAYNGASIGGVIFSPLLVALIAHLGFVAAAGVVGAVAVTVVGALAVSVLGQTPQRLGQVADGDAPGAATAAIVGLSVAPLPGRRLWTDRRFLTLAAAMALSLFAQIGLIAHLYVLLVPVLGAQVAGFGMALATACAIGGRTLVVRVMPVDADRRVVVCASYAVQVCGSLVLLFSGGAPVLILLGILLFGAGIGNATSLPPLVAQTDFAREDVGRVVALIVAIAQAAYAFAPAVFGVLLALGGGHAPQIGAGTDVYFLAAALIQVTAIACMLAGRRKPC